MQRLGSRTWCGDFFANGVRMPVGRLLARVNADDAAHVREADAVGVTFDSTHVHLFAPGECGVRI